MVLPLNVTLPVPKTLLCDGTWITTLPWFSIVPPEYVLLTGSNSIPAPVLVTEPAPEIVPDAVRAIEVSNTNVPPVPIATLPLNDIDESDVAGVNVTVALLGMLSIPIASAVIITVSPFLTMGGMLSFQILMHMQSSKQ